MQADVIAETRHDRTALWQAFAREGVAGGEPPPPDDTPPVVDAALAFVARTNAPLCLLPIEDVLGQEEQPNLPGTMDEHPNWRRRLPGEAGSILDAPAPAERAWPNWRRGGLGDDRAARDDAAANAPRLHLRRCGRVWCRTSRRWESVIFTHRRSSRPGRDRCTATMWWTQRG